MPPARYLSRKSPKNELDENSSSAIVPSKVTLIKLLHELKTPLRIVVTLLGIVMLVKLIQP